MGTPYPPTLVCMCIFKTREQYLSMIQVLFCCFSQLVFISLWHYLSVGKTHFYCTFKSKQHLLCSCCNGLDFTSFRLWEVAIIIFPVIQLHMMNKNRINWWKKISFLVLWGRKNQTAQDAWNTESSPHIFSVLVFLDFIFLSYHCTWLRFKEHSVTQA